MKFTIEVDQESETRWLAEIPQISSIFAYGDTRNAAISDAKVLALRAIADMIEHNQFPQTWNEIIFVEA